MPTLDLMYATWLAKWKPFLWPFGQKKNLDKKKILDNKKILAMERSHQEIYHTRRLVEPPGPDFKTALPSQYLLLFWLSLTNTESETSRLVYTYEENVVHSFPLGYTL